MFHPTYVWIFYNWYRDKYWETDNPSCIRDKSVKPEDLEGILKTAITLDQFPLIEDERRDEPNVGKIVSG